jgi:TonB family protein
MILYMAQPATCGILLLAVPLMGVAQQPNQSHKDTSRVFVVSDAKKPTKMVKPSYPESAKSAGIQGSVVIYVVIGKTGEVERVEPISGPKELWPATVDAVKQWLWEPFVFNGNPIRVRITATINFVLNASHPSKARPASQ